MVYSLYTLDAAFEYTSSHDLDFDIEPDHLGPRLSDRLCHPQLQRGAPYHASPKKKLKLHPPEPSGREIFPLLGIDIAVPIRLSIPWELNTLSLVGSVDFEEHLISPHQAL